MKTQLDITKEMQAMTNAEIGNLFYRLFHRGATLKELEFAKENGHFKLLAPMENKEKASYKITKNSIRQEKYLEALEVYKQNKLMQKEKPEVVVTYNKFLIEKVTNEIVEINNKARKEAVLKYHRDKEIEIPSNMLKVLQKY